MKIIRTLIFTFATLVVSVSVSAASCIYGWGLQPKDWLWIIGPSIAGVFLNGTILAAMKSED